MVDKRGVPSQYLRCKRWTLVALVTLNLAIRMVATVKAAYQYFVLKQREDSIVLIEVILGTLTIPLMFIGLCTGVLRGHLVCTVVFALVSLAALFSDLVTAFQLLLSAINLLLMLVITILSLLYIQDLVLLRRRCPMPTKPTRPPTIKPNLNAQPTNEANQLTTSRKTSTVSISVINSAA